MAHLKNNCISRSKSVQKQVFCEKFANILPVKYPVTVNTDKIQFWINIDIMASASKIIDGKYY